MISTSTASTPSIWSHVCVVSRVKKSILKCSSRHVPSTMSWGPCCTSSIHDGSQRHLHRPHGPLSLRCLPCARTPRTQAIGADSVGRIWHAVSTRPPHRTRLYNVAFFRCRYVCRNRVRRGLANDALLLSRSDQRHSVRFVCTFDSLSTIDHRTDRAHPGSGAAAERCCLYTQGHNRVARFFRI